MVYKIIRSIRHKQQHERELEQPKDQQRHLNSMQNIQKKIQTVKHKGKIILPNGTCWFSPSLTKQKEGLKRRQGIESGLKNGQVLSQSQLNNKEHYHFTIYSSLSASHCVYG